jgi:hypothetical protein
MFRTALARAPDPSELEAILSFVEQTRRQFSLREKANQQAQSQINELQQQNDSVFSQARKELGKPLQNPPSSPKPIVEWNFKEVARTSLPHGLKLHGNARIESGALVVRDGGYAVTSGLPDALQEKTLEAWVQLDRLDQRGGGVLTVQSSDGRVFDSIVFGEKRPRHWLAGSNFFEQTKDFGGPPEQAAAGKAVHLILLYDSKGGIRCYRNGELYGQAYQSGGPQRFPADESVISLGVRHLPAAGNRLLSGRIYQAAVYDQALSEDQVRTRFRNDFISREQLFETLSEQQQNQVRDRRAAISRLREQLQPLPYPQSTSDERVWTELARTFFTLKEFIYVR